jgi:hypothetical protein
MNKTIRTHHLLNAAPLPVFTPTQPIKETQTSSIPSFLPNPPIHSCSYFLITQILSVSLALLIPQTALALFFFTILAIFNVIRNFPKGSRASRTMTIKVFVEPVAEDASAATGATDLDSFTAPAFFAINRED